MLRRKLSTPRPNARAGNVAGPRLSPLKTHRLRRRVVTQQTPFFGALCDRPGCHQPCVASIRTPARFCGHACRQAVRNVQDRERKWLWRGTLDGRKKRAYEYRAAPRRAFPRPPNTSKPPPSRSRAP
jgi:hypothetical protein